MYTQLWGKYLPVIRILLKRSVAGEQTLNLNVTDFERAGVFRKSGNKFDLFFSNGRAGNTVIKPVLAKELSDMLLEDKTVKDLFAQNDYQITMATNYRLGIKCIRKPVPVYEAATETVVEEG
ncbi:MAG: hypothetical protein ICV65_14930 [Flavisolibacter sp.]|nr:hypothetical protein [Flavisolibacter sp.]MBD0352440.1 hypothetical protein [Flavisolibacter sp.]